MSDILTTQETVRLCELERVIQKGKDTFVEVGTALAEIRDCRIYRATFKTFEEYCKDRWGFTRRYINNIIAAAEVVTNLGSIVPKRVPCCKCRNLYDPAAGHICNDGAFVPAPALPSTESQARPLTKLPAEQQPAAWEKAQEKAKEEGKPVAARHVEAAVAEVMDDSEPDPVIVDESKPTRRAPMKVIESEGMNIWTLAKMHLDRINKNDEFREKALMACISYCQKRIETRK